MSRLLARRGGKSFAGARGSFLFATLLEAALAGGAASRPASAMTLPPPAPPLPPPSGIIVNVSTVTQLQAAVGALASNTTVLIAPGIYHLTQTLRIRGGVANVALRGSTGNRNDVILLGSGMNSSGTVDICVTGEDATDVLIADLSIGDVFFHPIQVKGELGCDRVHLYDLRLFDAGQQFVKGTLDFADPNGVDDGIVEYCVIEYTTIGPAAGYTNGIDIHGGANWVIRYNLFRNIRVPATAPQSLGPAVLMWSGSSNTICESNTFIDCERSIAFGLGPQSGFAHSHTGGVIRNNFIYRTMTTHADAGISVWDSPGTEVLHNTVIQNGTYPNAIEYRFPGTTGVVIDNNLTDGAIAQRDGASGTLAGDVTSATASFFVNPSAGDLHLVSTAAAAIDKGVNVVDCPLDWDGQGRPIGPKRDVGADEYSAFANLAFFAVTPCRIVDTRGTPAPNSGPALSAGGQRWFVLTGACGIPSTAQALSLNATVTQSTAAGDLRLFAAGTVVPVSTTISYGTGQTRANNAVAALGTNGAVAVQCDQASGTVQFILDVNGYFNDS